MSITFRHLMIGFVVSLWVLGFSQEVSAQKSKTKTSFCEDELKSVRTKPLNWYFSGTNPYLDPFNSSQAQFLISMGAKLDKFSLEIENPLEFVKKINASILQKVEQGLIPPEGAIYFSDVFVGADGLLQFHPLETSSTPGRILFKSDDWFIPSPVNQEKIGRQLYLPMDSLHDYLDRTESNFDDVSPSYSILSNVDYLLGIKDGFFPGSFERHVVSMRAGKSEATFLHEIAHFGGYLANPHYMSAFRQEVTRTLSKETLSDLEDARLYFLNENLVVLSDQAELRLQQLFKSLGLSGNLTSSVLKAELNTLSFSKVQAISDSLIAFHIKERIPLGGVARTGSLSADVTNPLDDHYETMKRTTLYAWDPPRQIEILRTLILRYARLVELFARVSMTDWFASVAEGSTLTPALREILCEEPVSNLTRYQAIYCH